LAAGNGRKDLVETISDGQSVLLELVRSTEGTKPTEAQEIALCEAFNVSDKYLGIQREHHLERAIKYVESRLLARKPVCNIGRQAENQCNISW
jgi:hypothetical protein